MRLERAGVDASAVNIRCHNGGDPTIASPGAEPRRRDGDSGPVRNAQTDSVADRDPETDRDETPATEIDPSTNPRSEARRRLDGAASARQGVWLRHGDCCHRYRKPLSRRG